MTTLIAFDTAAAHCAAAILRDGKIVAHAHEDMKKGQAERLMPLLEELLEGQGLQWRDLDAIAVGTGPGNFTGVRIAVSAARGLRLALGVPTIGVSRFAALHQMCDADVARPVVLSLPSSRKGHVMVQYRANDTDITPPLEVLLNADGPSVERPKPPEDALYFGFEARALMDTFDPQSTDGASVLNMPDQPNWGAAIVNVAARLLAAGGPFDRPAPQYIRPADAAPPKDPAPVLLP